MLLDVETNATTKQILFAYKEKAKMYHPDKNNGHFTANKLFQLINDAKETLTDKTKRLRYDYTIGVRSKPIPEPEEKYIYVENESVSVKEIFAVGALGLAAGFILSKMNQKKSDKKMK